MKKALLLMVLLMFTAALVFGCSPVVDTPPVDEPGTDEPAGDDNGADGEGKTAAYMDGSYEGAAEGYKNAITVEVTIQGGKITAIQVLSHEETEGISDGAFEELTAAVIAVQGTDGVDTVSGATRTSKGFLAAVADALAKAAR